MCVCSWFTETTQSIFLSTGLKLLNTVRGMKQMYVEGGGNRRLLPTSQVHRQSLWRDKDHESISIRVRLGVAHRPVRRTRESLFPLRMAQGFLMEIWPLQKLNRCLPRGHNVVCSLVQWKRKAKATDPSCCSVCSS